ncbi:CPBP family intramembrane glutamic endopeptidase [Mediterraneibacter agrestimuris]|uniref:CPBP family intramembrane glutamic endopeptidase n=1 Tax=Mediterraneibacter agrestimuris TaxID=2941333 RepID=UPI0020401D3A|nr:CPBP family intramembrane glutamic endopeptidase [Mediterraneibacter agrestimuris]
MSRKLLSLSTGLALLQLLRILLKSAVFTFFSRTLISDTIFSLLFMGAASVCILLICKQRQIDLRILPAKISMAYWIFTFLVIVIFAATPFITQSTSLYDILFLIYGAAITPIFEELIFRGYVWMALEKHGRKFAYLSTTILFALWHIGYVDTVLWRVSYFNHTASIPQIIFWKVITGFIYGILLGAVRYKTNNAYSSMLLHSFLNTFGG